MDAAPPAAVPGAAGAVPGTEPPVWAGGDKQKSYDPVNHYIYINCKTNTDTVTTNEPRIEEMLTTLPSSETHK